MRISTNSCLCPFLVCLCFIQRCSGVSHHSPAKVPSKNQTKLANGETEVHHRPKRGWIWNQFFVLEEHMGPDPQYVGKLHSNSDKGDGSVRYILDGEGAGTIFIIDEVTGDIHATKSLDREKKSHYVLHAQALDRYTEEALEPKSEFIIKVQDINDNAPKFPDGPFVATVPEMSEVGTSVLQVTASDADDPTYGNSARIVYSILQGQPYFSVDPKTVNRTENKLGMFDLRGRAEEFRWNISDMLENQTAAESFHWWPMVLLLLVKHHVQYYYRFTSSQERIIRTALADMDREAREHYTVVIQAKDMAGQVGGLSGSTTINITLTDINDNPPKFPQKNYQLYVPESAQVGKPVGKIKANDEDLGINADIKYSIINSEGANTFAISADRDTKEGIISLKKPLNYERKKTYTLHIEGMNTHADPRFSYLGSFKDTATLKITVGDVDEGPVFSIDHYIMDVYENAPSGTEVGTVTARDPDSRNSPVRYFLDSKEDDERYFRVDEISGTIRTTQPLDREDTIWHNITVMASEVDNPSLLSHVPVTVQVLDVNDNPPEVAADEEVIVCESSRPGQVIQTVTAVDKDDFANGQRFTFALPSQLPVNPNFTLKDNEACLLSGVSMGNTVATISVSGEYHARVTFGFFCVFLCLFLSAAIVVLFITLRRSKKEPLIISEEDILRAMVVTLP
ncbi:unnamed protein product [Tetraodon nigroviridis]|uniref:Cadherin-12 n=1 Tax=Tetraodon nigroviridis TaxID=99883 RepID=Q4S7A3_TETNG|nr:unnamed protein product [Tetraodon nigroviridis]